MNREIVNFICRRQNVPAETIQPDSHLIIDLGLTSLDLMELALAMEERYGIEINVQDTVDLETVEKISLYIDSLAVSAG